MIATTLEQSKKLVELGIDISTADMYIDINHEPIHIGVLPTNGDIDYESMDKHNLIPGWSLNALLDLLPESIVIDEILSVISVYPYDGLKYVTYVKEDELNETVKAFSGDSYVNAAFEMVVWLKENNWI